MKGGGRMADVEDLKRKSGLSDAEWEDFIQWSGQVCFDFFCEIIKQIDNPMNICLRRSYPPSSISGTLEHQRSSLESNRANSERC